MSILIVSHSFSPINPQLITISLLQIPSFYMNWMVYSNFVNKLTLILNSSLISSAKPWFSWLWTLGSNQTTSIGLKNLSLNCWSTFFSCNYIRSYFCESISSSKGELDRSKSSTKGAIFSFKYSSGVYFCSIWSSFFSNYLDIKSQKTLRRKS